MKRVPISVELAGKRCIVRAGDLSAEFEGGTDHDFRLAETAAQELVRLAAGFSEADVLLAIYEQVEAEAHS